MANLKHCPGCGRAAKDAWTSNHFHVYACLDCGRRYCWKEGSACPRCGSRKNRVSDTVYA